MKELIKKLFRDTLTEPDGVTFCPARAIALATALSGLGLAIFAVVVNHEHFNFLEFGGGAGALLAGTGAALGFKKDATP